jgi:hypothetical protein
MIKFVSDIWQVSDILWVLLYMIKFVSDIWQVSDILWVLLYMIKFVSDGRSVIFSGYYFIW